MAEVKVWNGSAWVSARVKAYDGTSWEVNGFYRDGIWKPLYPELDQGEVVSATADGDTNYEWYLEQTYCYAGVQFRAAGSEYECNSQGSFISYIGDWLTSGSGSNVWVAFTKTGGNASAWDSGQTDGTRYQLNVNRDFYILDSPPGLNARTIEGYFQFYDAASGGNILDRAPDSGSSTWSAHSDNNTN
jgi:hypothetical protein